jgi:hypothetical protein
MNTTLPARINSLFVLFCLFTANTLLAQTSVVTSAIGVKANTVTTSGTGFSWNNAANVQAEDNSFAYASITGANKTTNNLDAINWGFQSTNSASANYIPSTATINGIKIAIKRKKTGTGSIRDSKVVLLFDNNGNLTESAANRATTTSWPTVNAYAAYGSELDLWGALATGPSMITPAMLTSGNFGVRVVARNKGKKAAQAEIDYIKITVYFNQVVFYSKSTGPLESLTSWATTTGTLPATFAKDGQLFILNRASAALTGNLTISGVNSGLIIGDGPETILTIPPAYTLTANTSLKDNSSLIINNTTIPTLNTIGTATTITYGAAANQTIADASYYNLKLEGSGTKSFTANTALATSVSNNLTIAGGVIANNMGNTIVVGGAGIINNGSALGSGTYQVSLADVNGTLAGNGIYSNLEIDAATSGNTPNTVAVTGPTVVNGNLTLTDGTFNNGSNLTMSTGSTIRMAEGTLGSTMASAGYNVAYLTSSNTAVVTGNELTGTVRNIDVQMASNATLSLSRNIALTGNLTVTSGTLDVSSNNYNIALGGNLVNNSTLNLRNNTVTLNGSAVQTINGTGSTAFNNLIVNNTAGGSVQLTRPVTLSNTLSLLNGVVSSSAINTLTMGANATFTGGSANSYINGPLNQTVNSLAATKTFPIGKNGTYRPFTLSVTQATTASTIYTAEMFSGTPAARSYTTGIQNVSLARYYTVSSSNAANLSSATVKLSYESDEQVLNPAILRVARSSGTQWLNAGGAGTAVTTGTITSDPFASLGDFVLANVNVISLPLTWLSFNATKKTAAIELKWQTAQEINTYNFIIEKSNNGQNWSNIGVVTSNNQPGAHTYSFTDAQPAAINYYRVKQVDIDGKFSYSKTIRVVFSSSVTDLVVYPTVIRSGAVACMIKHESLLKSALVNVSVYDFSGKLVYSVKTKPAAVLPLNVTGLTSGQYQILISNDDITQQAKVLVQ